jgi:ribonuclease E
MLDSEPTGTEAAPTAGDQVDQGGQARADRPTKKATRTRRRKAATAPGAGETAPAPAGVAPERGDDRDTAAGPTAGQPSTVAAPLFLAPEAAAPEEEAPAAAAPAAAAPAPAAETTGRRRTRRTAGPVEAAPEPEPQPAAAGAEPAPVPAAAGEEPGDGPSAGGLRTRRRGRRGRGRGKGGAEAAPAATAAPQPEPEEPAADSADAGEEEAADGTVRRRRRRRRRSGEAGAPGENGQAAEADRAAGDEVRGLTGSTRLEAKRQRRRGGRDQRRTRPPVLSESEFLSRREAVDRVMVIREKAGRTQIAVLEDGILVEHYVSRASGSSIAGSVYLGKVQNVLPSMEAAFVDVGRGRNAVLYAGEVNWDAAGLEGKSRSIEQALKAGDSVLVQVTKDPVGHKGARLTSHIALSGRHLVYVPNGNSSGISRKLPDTERRRLRSALKNLVPDSAGVIVRTAAEGASEEDLTRDVKRLQAQWDDILAKAAEQNPPALLYAEPDLVVRVVRDLFNEDFRELVIEGGSPYETVEAYLSHVSPDLVGRLRRHAGRADVFAEYRIDEQILKGLDRKVYLPSGGHLVIDRAEAMTVIDVNTGRYTGTGGNLEETVTRNNLEAAEEIVRQLRLRDLGGIIVIDFIDMVLESNRDLVLRRLTECLGRDRTKHQVTEITSLGLVQMTRKRVGAGLLEVFSEPCECCNGRGVVINLDAGTDRPKVRDAAEKVKAVASASTGSGRRGGGRSSGARGGAGRSRSGRRGAGEEGEPEITVVTSPDSQVPADAPAAGDAPTAQPAGSPRADGPPVGGGADVRVQPDLAVADPADDEDRRLSSTGEEPVMGKVLRRFRLGTSRRTRT